MAGKKKLLRKSEPRKLAPKKLEVNIEAGLTNTGPAATSDYIIEEIRRGTFDEHIRDLARACFKRREAIKGDAGVTHEANRSASPEPKATPKPVDDVTPAASTPPGNNMLVLSPYTLVPVPKGSRVGTEAVFRYRGKRYWRSHVVGMTIKAHTIHGIPKAMTQCDLKVVGVEDTGLLLVKIDSRPRSRQGRFMDAWKNQSTIRLGRAVTDQLIQSTN